MERTTLFRVVAPHFVAGFEVSGRGRVVLAAPAIGYARGWSVARARAYFARKGWKVEVVG